MWQVFTRRSMEQCHPILHLVSNWLSLCNAFDVLSNGQRRTSNLEEEPLRVKVNCLIEWMEMKED